MSALDKMLKRDFASRAPQVLHILDHSIPLHSAAML